MLSFTQDKLGEYILLFLFIHIDQWKLETRMFRLLCGDGTIRLEDVT